MIFGETDEFAERQFGRRSSGDGVQWSRNSWMNYEGGLQMKKTFLAAALVGLTAASAPSIDDNAGLGRNDPQRRRDADQQPPSRTAMARLFSVLVKPVVSGGLAFSLAAGGAPAALGASERVVYAFESKQPDGANPWGALINVQGSLYGTTFYAGEGGPIGKCAQYYGCGTVFKLSPPAGAGGPWTESMPYVFKGGDDGKFPRGALIMVGGALYGATVQGGARDFGTVFKLVPPTITGGSWTKSLVYSFNGGSDGANPRGGVINVGGTLYGTTARGGGSRGGTVFKLDPPAISGAVWTHSVLYDFTGPNHGLDGAYPDASLINFEATLYGPTYRGGIKFGCAGNGCGTVFAVTLP
jgi:uncharacterized repeat protein (TIGR03803 family)